MPGCAGTVAKLPRDWSGRCQNEARKVSIFIKLQRGTATKLLREYAGWSKLNMKSRHNYKATAKCQDGLERLHNCSEIGRDAARMKQPGEANISIKLKRDARTGQDDYKTAARLVGAISKL